MDQLLWQVLQMAPGQGIQISGPTHTAMDRQEIQAHIQGQQPAQISGDKKGKSGHVLSLEICNERPLDNKSRMKRELHVRFRERLGLKCPCLLDLHHGKESSKRRAQA